ncbi:MAG: PKD domain-containing protein, partial [Methanophagales archaeon]|nr:PKD domain-containing protein [Methanophagales archaeon]
MEGSRGKKKEHRHHTLIFFGMCLAVVCFTLLLAGVASAAPTFYDDFSDGKFQDRTGTDPWGRPLPEWKVALGSVTDFDASTGRLRMTRKSGRNQLEADFSALGDEYFKLSFDYRTQVPDGAQDYVEVRIYNSAGDYFVWTRKNDGHHWYTLYFADGSCIGLLGGSQAPMIPYATGSWTYEDMQWHHVDIERHPDHRMYILVDGLRIGSSWASDYGVPADLEWEQTHSGNIELWDNPRLYHASPWDEGGYGDGADFPDVTLEGEITKIQIEWSYWDHEAERYAIDNIVFQSLDDNVSPYTSGHSPAKDAAGVSRDTNIAVHILDEGVGIDQSSIVMTVEETPVTPIITGTGSDYTVTYTPPTTFDYGQVVDITINAQELAGNIMPQDSYSFTIESAPDTTSPAAVTNLATSNPTANSIILTWTAPGDDENTGTASEYDIRYSLAQITEANWDYATQCTDEPNPQVAGSTETITVTGLSPDTTYYFALKTADEVSNWSGISNSPSGTTTEETYLVAEWDFDDGSGTVAYDSSGNNNNGTLTNMVSAAAWVDGKIGKALQFDGVDDCVNCGNDSSFDFTSAITIEAWIKTSGSEGWQEIVDKYHTGWYLDINSGGHLSFRVVDSNLNSQSLLPLNDWVHIAATYKSGERKVYLNGKVDNQDSQTGSIGTNKYVVSMGSRMGQTNAAFKGAVDEVKIYNIALSAEEISAHYQEGLEDTIPPASISNLQNNAGTTWINWTWTNPLDNDFRHTKVYLDGIWQTNTSSMYFNATNLTPNTTYEIGTRTVDTTGNVNSTWVNQTAKTLALNSPPVSDPNNPYTGTEGVSILFKGSGSYDPDGTIVSYLWAFGDGKNATEVNPTHTYTQNGTYNVTLTVTDNEAATNANTTTAAIADTEPAADFSATPTSGQEPLTVAFTDNSASHDGIVAWNWDFNNDSVTDSTEQNPTHVY